MESGFGSFPVVGEAYYVPSTGLRSVRPQGTLNTTPDAHGTGLPGSNETLWAGGVYWAGKIEQNSDKEKRSDSWQEKPGAENDQCRNGEGTAGAAFTCGGVGMGSDC